jgi:zinc transporter ZupT
MQSMLSKLFLTIALSITIMLGLAAPVLAQSTPQQYVCAGVGIASGNGCKNPTNGPDVNSVVRLIINILSVIVGVAAVIMIIIGGLKYITSGGDSAGVTSAKNTILYAIVGLIVVALAQVIVRFVLRKLS